MTMLHRFSKAETDICYMTEAPEIIALGLPPPRLEGMRALQLGKHRIYH